LLTKSAPGLGHSGGADKIGGVVEATEDAGGEVGADPLQEVPAAAHVRHGATSLLSSWGGLGDDGERSVNLQYYFS
jgi:hypothetical protein